MACWCINLSVYTNVSKGTVNTGKREGTFIGTYVLLCHSATQKPHSLLLLCSISKK